MKNQTFTVKDGREGAVLILLYGFEKGIGLREIEREVLAGSNLNRPAVSFMTELVRGTLERLLTIDYCIGKFSKTAVRKMKPLIRSDLRVAVYQLLYLTKTPASAVVNTAVTIAGQHGFTGLKGFVNGLLRNISRCRDELIEEVSSAKDPEVRYSVPSFVIDLLTADYGEEKTEKTVPQKTDPQDMLITVNGDYVILKRKDHYILVDVLDFYHVDTAIPHGDRLELKVNDKECDFTEPLEEGDEVVIKWVMNKR